MLYRRGSKWWFKFRFAGRVYREPAKTSSKTLAREVERVRRREIEAAYGRVPKRRESRRPHAVAAPRDVRPIFPALIPLPFSGRARPRHPGS